MLRRAPALAVGLAVVVVVATGIAVPVSQIVRTATAPDSATSDLLVTDAVPVPRGGQIAALPSSDPISLTLTLGWSDPAGLAAYLAAVESPSSPTYHHFLTYAEFLGRFAPAAGTVAGVVDALGALGARDIDPVDGGVLVTLVATPSEVERIAGVPLVSYGYVDGRLVYTAVGAPTLAPDLRGSVVGIGGLSNSVDPGFARDLATEAVGRVATGPNPSLFVHDNQSGADWFIGSDYAQAYEATSLWPGTAQVSDATYPSDIAIATLLASSYNNTTATNLPPWDPAVVGAYFNDTLGPGWPMPHVGGVPVLEAGITPPMPGSLGNLTDSSGDEIENSLDVEMAGSLAPGSVVRNFYFAGSLLEGSFPWGNIADFFAGDLAAALAYNYSPARLAVVSGSFGLPNLNDSAWNTVLTIAAGTGVTVVMASGDQGDAPGDLTGRGADGQWPVWPATAAFNTTGSLSVGGVTVDLAGAPTEIINGTTINISYDPSVGNATPPRFNSMLTWYDQSPGGVAGSEGGIATADYPEPWWQFHSAAQPEIANATVKQGLSTLGRAGPDLAMPANNTIAYVFENSTGVLYYALLEGTSIAAPVMSGILADVVAVLSKSAGVFSPLGFLDPEIYRIASYYAAHADEAGDDPLFDVTQGSNYVFTAGPGWSAATGWGGFLAPLFLSADRNATIADYVYNGSTPTLPPPTAASSATFSWSTVYAILGLGVVAAIVLVIVAARPRHPRSGTPSVPFGATTAPPGGGGGSASGATFLCPYCGGIRPAEPVRCPHCGKL